ncbi:TVP38/TMEM64 family protein [Okeanomitos corallinicola TIOX110]|uniref:TVP38/TMEM64 family membrane protein n=1 Tax=Okeanomitos corallinicola TIOX110 TaxID=3133117 RepID=A0ABZ2UP42_9CYAN
MPNHKFRKFRLNRKLKFLCLTCLVITLIVVSQSINIQQNLQTFITWVENLGIWGPIGFIIIYNIGTLLFIPGSLLTINGGFLFGLFWGSVYVLIAAMIGAILAFVMGRYISKDWICQQLEKHPKFKAIDHAVTQEGWKIVLLTRLSPLFPFNLLNYAFGVTNVSIFDYILGSFGIIPGTVMYVYIGSITTNLTLISTNTQPTSLEIKIWQYILQAVGLIATIYVSFYITKIAQKALNEKIEPGDIKPRCIDK